MTARAVLGETKEGKVMPMTRKRDPYAPLPLTIMAHTTLSMGARVCYAALRHFARDEATCFPSLAALAASIGTSERMTRRYVDDLEEAGAVTVQRRGQGHSNLYTLCDTPPTHQARRHYRKDVSGLDRPDVSHLDRTDMATHTSAVPAPMAGLDRTDMATLLNKEGLEAIKKSTTTADAVGASAPPAAQAHEPRAHDAPTEESLPPARTAAAETEQQEPESSPVFVFEEETAPPAPPAPPRRQRQSSMVAPPPPVAETPTRVQARALLATLGVEVTPVTVEAMAGVVDKWAVRCEKACGMTLEEKALDARCWLDGPVARQKKRRPSVQFFRGWVQRDTEEAEKAPPVQPIARLNGNGQARAAPSGSVVLTPREEEYLAWFQEKQARKQAEFLAGGEL